MSMFIEEEKILTSVLRSVVDPNPGSYYWKREGDLTTDSQQYQTSRGSRVFPRMVECYQ